MVPGQNITLVLPSGSEVIISLTDIDFTIDVSGNEVYSEYKVNGEWGVLAEK